MYLSHEHQEYWKLSYVVNFSILTDKLKWKTDKSKNPLLSSSKLLSFYKEFSFSI